MREYDILDDAVLVRLKGLGTSFFLKKKEKGWDGIRFKGNRG
jgi:hypothetical protein